MYRIATFFICLFFMGSGLVHAETIPNSGGLHVWANTGEDKVTQDQLRFSKEADDVTNSIWDGTTVTLFGAKNEVVSFNLIIEAPSAGVNNVCVIFDSLSGPSGASISSLPAQGDGIFNWVNRNIELFFVRYLEIKGLSLLSYEALYDERHVPERFRRPWTGEGDGTGTWEDRPDHNKLYPDIAVPLELVDRFDIEGETNQSIWVDLFIPKTATAGLYQGMVTISADGQADLSIPVSLDVYDFTLPDYPSAPSMLYYSSENINYRYLGTNYVDPSSQDYTSSISIIDNHFKVAHRHKISLISSDVYLNEMAPWIPRLDGSLFTAAGGYDGPGISTGNNVFSIGSYGGWTYAWSENSKEEMWSNTDAWVDWFDTRAFTTATEYFLYLIDEDDDFERTENWAQWMDSNPGSGSRLMSMATISSPSDWENNIPSLDIPTSSIAMGMTDLWENATQNLVSDPTKRFYYYNGTRPASGSFCIEDDGVALRVNGWIQHKKQIDRWFFWESTYYNNFQGGTGETDVFNQAFTYGTNDGIDTEYHRGESGWNYMNGDGVLFYPGTDTHYPDSSYGVTGPFASLRLKHWRRGVQDADYLALASEVDAAATAAIVERMIPKVLWENGVENTEDPTYVYCDISWSTDPDVWEQARKQLADIIVQNNVGPETTIAVLTDDSMYIIPTGSAAIVYGSQHDNSVTVKSGLNATLVNFPGNNTIVVESDSGLFTVYRSGAIVIFQGSDGTTLKMPATVQVQQIKFNDSTLNLVIESGAVMLDRTVVETEARSLTQEENQAIIVDHTCVDISQIPDTWLQEVKSNLRLSYGHTSHGSQPITGMHVLQNTDLTYNFTTDGSVISGHLSIEDYTPDGDLGHLGDVEWADRTRSYLAGEGSDRNVVIWSWCGGVSDNTQSGIQAYLNAMSQLESEFPNITFVYMTGHLDGTGTSGNLNQKNNQIRQYCEENNKVLFDFADIESYDPDGGEYLNQGADDGCYYDNMSGNWAQEWCDANPGSSLCESCDCAHSHPLNCNLKARAFWFLLARIAGWKGE